MYLHAYGKSGLEMATNTVVFMTEFFPFGCLDESPICDKLSPLK